MGIEYLWDTNTCIYYLQEVFEGQAAKFIDNSIDEPIISVSIISEIELLCWRSATERGIDLMSNFISSVEVFNIDQEVKTQTISIRKAHRVKLPDALGGKL